MHTWSWPHSSAVLLLEGLSSVLLLMYQVIQYVFKSMGEILAYHAQRGTGCPTIWNSNEYTHALWTIKPGTEGKSLRLLHVLSPSSPHQFLPSVSLLHTQSYALVTYHWNKHLRKQLRGEFILDPSLRVFIGHDWLHWFWVHGVGEYLGSRNMSSGAVQLMVARKNRKRGFPEGASAGDIS